MTLASFDSDATLAKRIIESMPGHAWSADPDGRFTYVSASTIAYLGQPVEELGPVPETDEFGWRRVVHPDDYERVVARWRHCLKTGDRYDTEHRIRRADGAYRWFRNSGMPSRDEQGRIKAWYGTTIDIDEQKQAEAALREREGELAQLVEMVPGHLWRLGADGEPIFFSRHMVEFLGFDVDDLDGRNVGRLQGLTSAVHPDDAQHFRDALDHSLATGENFSLRYRLHRRDGTYRWMSSRAEPMRDRNGDVVEWYGLCHDVDDEVQAQQTLLDRERELSQLVDMVPVQIRRLTPQGEPTFFNKRLADFFGLDVANLDGSGIGRMAHAISTLVHPDDSPTVFSVVSRSLATGEPFAMRYRMRRADGEYRWVDGRGEPVRDQSGAILHWYAISIDIDDQMRLYSDLEEREAKIRRLVDSDIIGIVIWDLDGRLIDANDAFLRMVQFDREDLQAGLRWFDITPPEWQDVHARDELQELEATGKMQVREKEYFRKDGSRVPVLIGAACFEGPSRQGVAYILDLTERKRAEAAQLRAEEALRRAQDKLARASQAASLAELSASIAHEVNQPLAAIVANSHACHRWLSADPPNVNRAKSIAERINRDANSAADVVSRIRALFRRAPEAKVAEDLNLLIEEVNRLMADEVNAKAVRIHLKLDPDLPHVRLDRIQLQQVFLNLIRNGLEAMDAVAGATRRIDIRSTHDEPEMIRVEVSDGGAGFENTDRVFQPFFTTKQQGMGMGLAICRSIIESHGGRLWVSNNQTRGATVAFTLPRSGAQ